MDPRMPKHHNFQNCVFCIYMLSWTRENLYKKIQPKGESSNAQHYEKLKKVLQSSVMQILQPGALFKRQSCKTLIQ